MGKPSSGPGNASRARYGNAKPLPSRTVGGDERPRGEWIEVPVPAW